MKRNPKASKPKKSRRKKNRKNVQWWGGLLLLLSSLAGCGFSIYTVYFGVMISASDPSTFSTIMTEYNMSLSQIATAVIITGSILLIYFILASLVSALSIFTAGSVLRKRTLFWMALVVLVLDMVFFTIGLIDLWLLLCEGISATILCIGVYQRFSPNMQQLSENRPSRR